MAQSASTFLLELIAAFEMSQRAALESRTASDAGPLPEG